MHNDRPMVTISKEEIRKVRDNLQETQAVFGARFGVDQATVHRWETRGIPARGTTRVLLENFLRSQECEAAE